MVDDRVAIAREIERLRKTEGPEAAARFVATAPLKATREVEPMPADAVLSTSPVTNLVEQTSLLARDGTETQIAGSAAPVRDREGCTMGTVLFFRNESSARRARRSFQAQNDRLEIRVEERLAELRDSQEHLLGLISNVPAVITFVDADQRYVFANAQYMDDYAVKKIKGCTVRQIIGEERHAVVAPLIARVLGGEQLSHDWQPSR